MAQNLFLEKDNPVDFLYLDRNRISSLMGQLSDRGMLVGLKSVVAKSEGREGTAGGSIAVAKAEGKASRILSESAEETYDPFWTHAYSFLKDLESNFAVPLDQARMGSLVKFDAFIQFLDLKSCAISGNRQCMHFCTPLTRRLPKPVPRFLERRDENSGSNRRRVRTRLRSVLKSLNKSRTYCI